MFKFRDHKIDIGLIVSSVALVVGILLSFYGAAYSNLIILLGTFGLGLGFYLKANHDTNVESGEKLSSYGHFMVGLAALITLPQAPQMLEHILKIEKAVTELQAIRENQDSESVIHSSAPLKETKSPIETLDIIKGLVRSENGISGSPSKNFSSEENRIPFSGAESRPNVAEDSPSQPTYPQSDTYVFEKKAPIPGMAYLTPKKAEKIIATLRANKFDKNMAEALVRENLEVWHPLGRPSRYQKHIKRE